jgi:phage/plasmid-like protein (TIGR03299 family)
MAHEMQDDDYMVSAGNKVPWHGLGSVLTDSAITAAVAVKEAKLEWEVTKEDVFDSDVVKLDDFRLLRRSDTRKVLSVVPRKWTPLQNLALLEIAEALAQAPGTGDFKPVIETAGSLRGGKVVYALVQTGQRDFGGSQHKQFMLLSNGHYLGRGVRGTLTDVRVVCANTLAAAENAKASLFTTHFGDVEQRVNAAIEALGWATEATKATFAIYEALAKSKCSEDRAYELFLGLFSKDEEDKISAGDSDKVDAMVQLFHSGRGNEGKSMFDAINAVTDWVDHSKEYRQTATADERRFMDTTMDGNGLSMKRKALRLAQQLVLV